MNCEDCKTQKNYVSYVAHESAVTDYRLMIKRLWILVIILIICLVGSNAAWIWYENQFTDEITTTYIAADQQTDTGGNNYAVGGDLNGITEG